MENRLYLFLTFLFIFITHTSFSQQIRFIDLLYTSSVKLENSVVKVRIYEKLDHSYQLKVEARSMRSSKGLEKVMALTEGQYQKIVTALQKIRTEDVLAGPEPIILDGTTCSISYGINTCSITYTANTPNHDTGNRKLSDFLSAFELILTTGELDPKAII